MRSKVLLLTINYLKEVKLVEELVGYLFCLDTKITSQTFRISGTLVILEHTAKTQYRKFETNIPRKGIARAQSQFPHSCVCERFIYSHDRSAYSAAGKYVDRPALTDT